MTLTLKIDRNETVVVILMIRVVKILRCSS